MTTQTFEHIANEIRPRLTKLCERFVTDRQMPEQAEDIVQETFFRLWQMRERLDAYESPESLAVAIAKNVCIDHLRRQRMRLEPLGNYDVEDTQKTDQPLITSDTETWIQNTLNRLPATQRRMLTMRSEGMSLDEISTLCNTTKQSTKTMISAARRFMLEMLKKGGQR
jgi:RNA polymerase sigma-70 factor (ECF subfamily)